jgi:dTMP kinase
MFIAIEGPDGCGKDTQVELLATHLQKYSRVTHTHSFPRYSGPVGACIVNFLENRDLTDPKIALEFQALMTVDRYDCASTIEDQLDEDATVIVSRWWPSGFVYGVASGLDPQWLLNTQYSLPRADVNILLTAPWELRAARIAARANKPRDAYEESAFQQKVVQGYSELWARMQEIVVRHSWCNDAEHATGRWLTIDAAKEPSIVADAIWKGCFRA